MHLPVPWLGGDAMERIFSESEAVGEVDGCVIRRAGGLLLGCAVQPVGDSMKLATRRLYQRILGAAADRSLYRIWNYVPQINEHDFGVENYRAFCAGRAEAFEAVYGFGFEPRLPAASAVGCGGGVLAALFAAGDTEPRHLENAQQIPAYEYPPEHGPRSPSFSRATIVTNGEQRLVFVSGTAAIKGHATIAPGELEVQLTCTLDNLRIISRAAELGTALGRGGAWHRHFKVYVRRPADYVAIRTRLERELIAPGDRVIYLRADICRAALLVEIEATLVAEPRE